jgi:hypothetical protein
VPDVPAGDGDLAAGADLGGVPAERRDSAAALRIERLVCSDIRACASPRLTMLV